MKSIKVLVLLTGLSLLYTSSKAQTAEILGGNLLNGAIAGSMLGVAAMGLNNTSDFASARIGLGAGIIGGAGLIIYDYATLPRGDHLYISGLFNDGNNSSIIILLDTIYGAAGGAVIGTAGMLITERRVVEGLQYGASAGAWAGFAFGLVDALILSERNRDFTAAGLLSRDSIFAISKDRYSVDMLQPASYSSPKVSNNDIRSTTEPAVAIFSLSIAL